MLFIEQELLLPIGLSIKAAAMNKSVSLSEADILDELVQPLRSTLSARVVCSAVALKR